MAGKLLARKAQIAVELETDEGTAEVLAAADATMLVYDHSYNHNISRFTRNPARATLSMIKGLTGKQAAGIGWKTELKGSGDVTVEPAWSDAIQTCGFLMATVSTVAIGAVSSGPYLPGETLTGAGGGKGR